ncbi:serine/threonine protein kinase [Ktedonosporobacter rubrisoli]|uniref:serine/threonine protein kinase n=1 Tax=Ktedonosporobacter rubrisoli TaxID=2509675 RepID=UPI0013EE68E5|nr:serine/threonine-protein kinase [Ktedonosporobacter rubrisoli]
MSDLTGQQLGNYRLLRLVGQSKTASVYLAQHVRLRTQAAIKVWASPLQTEQMERFQREMQPVAGLIHPNILRVLDFEWENAAPFLAMDYVSGGSLRRLHQRGSVVSLPLVLAYVKQVASALQYAHDHDVIHGDVRPENMLVGEGRALQLSDFGQAFLIQAPFVGAGEQQPALAEEASQDAGDAGQGEVSSSAVYYMAPEQLQGKLHSASDQYGLAITIYEWLCGELPFVGTPEEVMMQHSQAEPEPLRSKRAEIPEAIEQAVMKALAKDPWQRFRSIQRFAAALERASGLQNVALPVSETLANGEPVGQENASLPATGSEAVPFVSKPEEPAAAVAATSRKLLSRRTALQGLSIVGALVVGSGAGALAWWWQSHQPAPVAANVKPTPTASRAPTATPSTATTQEALPAPASFKQARVPELNISLNYPSDWTMHAPEKSLGLTRVAFTPQQLPGISFLVYRYADGLSTDIKDADTLNQDHIATLASQGAPGLQNTPPAAPKPTIAGSSWSQQSASYVDQPGLKITVTFLSVQHGKDYYSIYYIAPDIVLDEATKKYYHPMLNSLQFLS